MLIFALAIVAVKSRKVRLQNFKDTKKVNILLFILSLDIFTSFSYWLLLQILNSKRYINNLPVHIGHSVLIVSFLSLLMVPNISHLNGDVLCCTQELFLTILKGTVHNS